MSDAQTTYVPEVTADALRDALEKGVPVRILDVRPRAEYDEWHVPDSRHVGGYEALKAGQDDVYANVSLPDDEPIVTVCGAGKTSALAARQLRERGKEAYSLEGGLRAWTFAWNVASARFGEVQVVQIRRTGKGCLSYLIGRGGEAVVVDPSLSPEVYEEQAAARKWILTGVLDTHVHADHLSRARWLAERTGAELYLPAQERVSFSHEVLGEGGAVEVGDAVLTALRTPGHTPESTTYMLDDEAVLTGDTLFLRGVGRPDLDAGPEEGRRKAHRLYRSLRRLGRLPDGTMVLPGHVPEPVPFDGEIVGAPLRTVKEQVDALEWSEERFVEAVTENVPPTPSNHEAIIDANTAGEWPGSDTILDLEAGANRCAVG